ncbi:MAG TPA: glycosyltransferase family 2 protein [Candidatus Omnitrophota bacterium]|mgnify:FL=1|nr:glycosyltransferase family 2 protein [Candidatus Omnitrophota bacterium]HPB68170.1 glycosyltransferase family 2 protein [Candidatus Omnitrophota bacterium]HQO57407.1 glycosyltransferase family 2 protein [Candidatus Omnitrophota bacterium]HQP12212.1 glycosyltransferase family 2 protein [Candidatus Omnitrophota bacterium]
MLNHPTVTAVVITKNEEARIRACLDSLKGWVDEIVVVDDMSEDRTVEIARDEYGATVIRHPLEQDFAAQRNRGMAAARSEWILEMDADEVVPPESARKIQEGLAAAGECQGFVIQRINCVFDRPLKNPGRSDSLRIVRKNKGQSRGVVHESLFVDGPVGRLEACVYHYNLPSISHFIERNNHYSDSESEEIVSAEGRISAAKYKKLILFKSARIFYKSYFKNKGRQDGIHGFIRAVLHAVKPVLVWLKVLERAMKEGKLDP